MKPSSILIVVSSDLSADQRVQKICSSLAAADYQVNLIGRKLANSLPFNPKGYKAQRYKLWFTTGAFFYANLNLRIFFSVLFSSAKIVYVNDLDTLLGSYLGAKLSGKKVVYDSHEYFTEVPELISRPKVQQVWEKIESWILPKLKHCITVSQSIAEIYNEKYNSNFELVRNFPKLGPPF